MENYILILIPIAISMLGVYISMKNRRNSMRENIFNRQLEFYQNFYSIIVQLEDCAFWLNACKNKNFPKELDKAQEKWEKLSVKLDYEYYKGQLLIPKKIAKKLELLFIYFSNLDQQIMEIKSKEINTNEIVYKIFETEDLIRNYIGLKRLNKENRRLISKYVP